MQSQSVQQLLFRNLVNRPVVVKHADFELSSGAGLLPIREFDRRWRLTERMCLEDGRSRHDHSFAQMLRPRLFGILADCEDCNDHDDLRHDPVFRIVAGRSVKEDALASQPTL